MRPLAAAAVALVVLPSVALAARTTELRNPVTIELATKATAAQVRKGVKTAVLARKWHISNDQGSQFDATYTRTDRNGTLKARVRIAHSPKKVTITYLSSEGLSAGPNQIHPTYNKWISNLEKDIPIYVERQVVAAE